MSQAAIDLPEAAATPAAPTSADDLLSQLAGEEIDRMLAETDAAPAPTPAGSVATEEPAPAPAFVEPVPQSEETQAAENTADAAAAVSAEVDELFRQLEEKPPAIEKSPSIEPQPQIAEPAAEPVSASEPVQPPVVEMEESTTSAERAALAAPAADETLESPVETESHETESFAPPVELKPSRPAIYVRVLELINGPFAHCPAPLRDTLGKIALLTLMNSIGVLVYVLLFRK